MSALNRVWHAIRRFIASADTTAAPNPGAGLPDRAHLRNGSLETLFAGMRRSCGFFRQIREHIRETQRDSEQIRQDAMRNERRAKRKSLILLMSLLNPEQRQEFRQYRYFHVTGGSSGDRYRIRVGMIANIDVLRNDGKVKYRLCVRPNGDIPVYDVMAGQLLHLQDPETEQRFRQQANIHSALPDDHVYFRTTWVS